MNPALARRKGFAARARTQGQNRREGETRTVVPREAGSEWEPPSEEQLAMAEQHAREHGLLDFELGRDVSFPGNSAPDALFTWNPVRRAYICRRCPGVVLYPDDKPSPAYLRSLAREPALQPLLSGLRTLAEREELAARVYQGELGRDLLRAGRERARMATRGPSPPEVTRRRTGGQGFMLAAYEECGKVDEAIGALLDLHRTHPERYQATLGTDRKFSLETFRDYWQAIPLEKRQAAKERFRARRAEERIRKSTR